jgi:cell division protein FtsQ
VLRVTRGAALLVAQAFRRPPALARPVHHDHPGQIVALVERHAPHRTVLTMALVLICGSAAFGVVRGGHLDDVTTALSDARNAAANVAGFRIASVAINGSKQLSHDEILAIGGVNGRSSLLFLDAATVRDRLKTNPWIADATVLKLYPGHLQIDVTERKAFALWQRDGQLAVIADDGAVLDSYVTRRFATLPLVVGRGADTLARDFLALVARYPTLRPRVKAAIYVGERRWNLRLDNGLDIRLPEHDVSLALDKLARLARDQQLFSRDITVVDLRLSDRVTVRLSEDAAKARFEALDKDRKAKRKAGNA